MIWFNQGPILQEEAVSHEFQIIIIINLAKTFKVGEALADNKMRLSHIMCQFGDQMPEFNNKLVPPHGIHIEQKKCRIVDKL